MPENKQDRNRMTIITHGGGKVAEEKSPNWWPWILAGGMVASAFIMCLCGRGCTRNAGCRDCNEPKNDTVWVVKEKPSIKVDGDAIIINGDNNDATMIKGNGNNSANRCTGDHNQNRGTVKPKPRVEPKPEPVKQEEKQEEKPASKSRCTIEVEITTKTTTYIGSSNAVIQAVANGRSYGN